MHALASWSLALVTEQPNSSKESRRAEGSSRKLALALSRGITSEQPQVTFEAADAHSPASLFAKVTCLKAMSVGIWKVLRMQLDVLQRLLRLSEDFGVSIPTASRMGSS